MSLLFGPADSLSKHPFDDGGPSHTRRRGTTGTLPTGIMADPPCCTSGRVLARGVKVLKTVVVEKKQTDERLQIRNHRVGRHTRVFGFAATITSQVLTLIGDTELAGKVRPSPRRAGNTQAVAEEEPETQEVSTAPTR